MEKIRLKDGSEFTLVVNGISESPARLRLTVVTGDKTVEEVQQIFNEEATKTIYLVGSNNNLMRSPWVGYTQLESIRLTPNQVINSIPTESGKYKDITGNVMQVVVVPPQVAYATQESVDELTDAILEMSEAVYGGE